MSYYKESLAYKLSQGTVHRVGKVIGLVWSPAVMWTGSCQDTKPVQETGRVQHSTAEKVHGRKLILNDVHNKEYSKQVITKWL